jgi:tetratricopeptide (TPR) repeat protein
VKIKTPYIYLSAIVLVIAGLIFFTQYDKKTPAPEKVASDEMPDDEIHRNLKNQHGKMGVNEETKKMMQEFEDALKKNPNDTAKMREYADFLAMAHKIDQAQSYYEKILSLDRKRKDILLSLSTIHFNRGNLDKAAELTNEMLKLDKNDFTAIYNLGVIEATRSNYDIARKHWERVIKESKDSTLKTAANKSLEMLQQTEKK